MLDVIGNQVDVGDEVVYIGYKGHTLKKGYVCRILPKTIAVTLTPDGDYPSPIRPDRLAVTKKYFS